MNDPRQLLADAQAAEVRGDRAEAIALLRRAAELYQERQLGTKALKLLRHIRRLEGNDDARVLADRGPRLADAGIEAWCSFCCRPNTEVGRLVAGPTGTFICAACIRFAQEMLR